jgi:hypothetical protein
MRHYKCCACGTPRNTKSAGLCPACYALVEPDDHRPRPNPELEKRSSLYQRRAERQEPLFPPSIEIVRVNGQCDNNDLELHSLERYCNESKRL